MAWRDAGSNKRGRDRRKNHETPERRPVVLEATLERGRRARECQRVEADVQQVLMREGGEDEGPVAARAQRFGGCRKVA